MRIWQVAAEEPEVEDTAEPIPGTGERTAFPMMAMSVLFSTVMLWATRKRKVARV